MSARVGIRSEDARRKGRACSCRCTRCVEARKQSITPMDARVRVSKLECILWMLVCVCPSSNAFERVILCTHSITLCISLSYNDTWMLLCGGGERARVCTKRWRARAQEGVGGEREKVRASTVTERGMRGEIEGEERWRKKRREGSGRRKARVRAPHPRRDV